MNSVNNFISDIEDRHLATYPTYQKALMVQRISPDKDYMRRFLIKKAKYEFVSDLMKKIEHSSKASTWKQAKLQFLQRVREAIHMSMHPEVTFAMEDRARYTEQQEIKRKNTWV